MSDHTPARPRIACSSVGLRRLPFDDAIGHIAAAGFELVELPAIPVFAPHIDVVGRAPGQAERIVARLAQEGVTNVGINTVAWYPDALDTPGELKARYECAADMAVATSAAVWVVDGGQTTREGVVDIEFATTRWLATMEMATELAAARHLCLAVESPHHGTLSEHPAATAALLDRAGPTIGVDFDTSHIFNSGCAVERALELLGPRLAHIAIRDCLPDGTFCVPGDGAFDFRGLITGLRKREYTGDLVIELETPGVDDPLEIMRDARRTERLLVDLLDELWVKPGFHPVEEGA